MEAPGFSVMGRQNMTERKRLTGKQTKSQKEQECLKSQKDQECL